MKIDEILLRVEDRKRAVLERTVSADRKRKTIYRNFHAFLHSNLEVDGFLLTII